MSGQVHVVDHPLVQHKLSLLRMRTTSSRDFKQLVGEISMLMAYEATKDLPTEPTGIGKPNSTVTSKPPDTSTRPVDTRCSPGASRRRAIAGAADHVPVVGL